MLACVCARVCECVCVSIPSPNARVFSSSFNGVSWHEICFQLNMNLHAFDE